MSDKQFTKNLTFYIQRSKRAIEAFEYDLATHECRKALELITRYVYGEVLHESYEPKKGLDGAIRAGSFRALWPRLLLGKIYLIKELGDKGSHVNTVSTEQEANEALNCLREVATYLNEHIVGRELSVIARRSSLTIEVETDLSQIRFSTPGGILKIDEPVLLLETLEGRNSMFRFQNKEDETANAFAEHALGTQVLKLIGNANTIRFGEAQILWDENYCDWPPSIDSLFTASLMIKNERLKDVLKKSTSFAEVGCGTGFISTIVCRHFPQDELFLTDVHEKVLDLAEFNIRKNVPEQVLYRKRGPGLRAFHLEKQRFDVMFANPPYIQVHPDQVEIAHSTFSTGLLEELVLDFHRYTKTLILNYSSCSENIVESILRQLKSEGVDVQRTIIGRRYAPFRVSEISLEDLETLASDERLIDLDRKSQRAQYPEIMADNRGYRYWHEIILAECRVNE